MAATTYTDTATQRVKAENGIEYAYRDLAEGDVPLVLLQHFRGNLDNWDPALIDALASDRPARLLHRQLCRAGDRVHPAGPSAPRRARVVGTAGRGRDAWLGA